MSNTKYALHMITWLESEAGWGQRPDGYSLHISHEVAKKYSDDYMSRQKEALGPGTPHEYSFPAGIRVVSVGQVVLVPSYDDDELDLERYIDLSNETGLYPSWGWTGEYYVTGVTHGPVERFEPGVTRNGSQEIYSTPGTVVPEPSAIFMLATGAWFITRRRRRG